MPTTVDIRDWPAQLCGSHAVLALVYMHAQSKLDAVGDVQAPASGGSDGENGSKDKLPLRNK